MLLKLDFVLLVLRGMYLKRLNPMLIANVYIQFRISK